MCHFLHVTVKPAYKLQFCTFTLTYFTVYYICVFFLLSLFSHLLRAGILVFFVTPNAVVKFQREPLSEIADKKLSYRYIPRDAFVQMQWRG